MIEAKDVKVEFYPEPKPGMKMHKFGSGIRVTHIPSGTSVIADRHRHVYKNRDEALELLTQILEGTG